MYTYVLYLLHYGFTFVNPQIPPPPQLYRYAAAVFLYRIEISQKSDHMTDPLPPPLYNINNYTRSTSP